MTAQEQALVLAAYRMGCLDTLNRVALVLRAFGHEVPARIVDETLIGLQIEEKAA